MPRVFSLRREDVEHLLQAAVDHYSASRLERAEQLLRGILAIEPDEWRAWQLLGSVLALQGFRVAATAVYLRCLELKPDDVFALAAVAEIAIDAMRFEDARAYVERLFALDPEGKHPSANRVRQVLAETAARLERG